MFFFFHIFMCDLFTILGENGFVSYLDYNTAFVSEATTEYVVISLESCSANLFEWFQKIRGNPEKCHPLIYINRSVTIKIG